MSRIVRRLRNPTVGFVGLSLGLHFGLLWLADIGFGRTVLTTPTAMAIVGVIAMQTAQFGPSIHERTGDFPRAAWFAVGVPLVLVAAGALLSIVLEGATISPATKSALFTPWWLLYPALTLWKVVHIQTERTVRDRTSGRVLQWAGAMTLIPLSAAAAIAVFSIQLTYFRPES